MSKILALLFAGVAVVLLVLLVIRTPGPVAPQAPSSPLRPAAASAGPAREFAVEGMSCDGCVQSVTAALVKLAGVQSAQVLLAEKKALVVADRDQVPDAQIIAAIGGAGYTGRAVTPVQAAAATSAPGKAESPSAKPEPGSFYCVEIPANLGDPLVDGVKDLKRLDKTSPAWLDTAGKAVVLMGTTCKAGYPLEFFATYPDRGYESVVVIYTKPSIVHAALLALGAKPGKPVVFDPAFAPPSGGVVHIDVLWKDSQGKRQKARAQDWIRDIKTKKPLDVEWVFAGSTFWEDKETGVKSYLADRGDFISVLNLPSALLDVPMKSASAMESRMFEGSDRLPPAGTPVTLVLRPELK